MKMPHPPTQVNKKDPPIKAEIRLREINVGPRPTWEGKCPLCPEGATYIEVDEDRQVDKHSLCKHFLRIRDDGFDMTAVFGREAGHE